LTYILFFSENVHDQKGQSISNLICYYLPWSVVKWAAFTVHGLFLLFVTVFHMAHKTG